MTSLPATPRCSPSTSPTSTPGASPRTCSGKAPNPGACPSPARRPGTSAATPPYSTPARNRRPRCSTPCGITVRRGCLTTTSPGSCASTLRPPKPDVPTSRPGSTRTCCATRGLSLLRFRPEARPNPGLSASCLTSIWQSVRHVRQGQYHGRSLFAAGFDLTWLTSLTLRGTSLPVSARHFAKSIRNQVQITYAQRHADAGTPVDTLKELLGRHGAHHARLLPGHGPPQAGSPGDARPAAAGCWRATSPA